MYKSNFGDSLQDVADAMAEVKQQTKETDPSKLKDLTENAITLRDTFGYDIQDSIKAVKMLMDQFGISGDEAFNLISQGAQNGLDKDGDLLEDINEYSVHYKQLGYDANDFFNSLANGTEAGTFSVNTLGDAMKEFGIQTKDTASSTQEGFEILGYSAGNSKEEIAKTKEEIANLEKNLKYAKMEQDGFNKKTSDLTKLKNADKIKEYSKKLSEAKENLKNMTSTSGKSQKSIKKLQDQFAKGGESAQKATKEVLKKLFTMDDKVKQNQAGVDLFGTMWEDLGIEGVKALMKTNGELDKSQKTMEEIKKIKYDDTMNQLSTLGREIEMEVIAPLAEKALPYAQKFFDYVENHLDETIKVVETVGGVVAAAFVVNKVAAFVSSIKIMVTTFSGLKTALEGATGAQKLLNAAQALSPAGLVAAAIGGLVAALVIYNKKMDDAYDKGIALTDQQKENRDAIDKLNDSYKEANEARDEATSNATAEYGYYESLVDELGDLIDANGKVKKGQMDRVKFIKKELKKACGIELKMTGRIIENYKEQRKQIKKLIEIQKAKAVLNANQDLYNQAKQKQTESFNNYTKAKEDVKATEKQVQQAQKKVKELQDLFNNTKSVTASIRVGIDLDAAEKELKGAKDKLNSMNQAVKESEKTWVGYETTIENYETLSAAIMSKNSKKIEKALNNMTSKFITAEHGTKETLQEQVNTTKKTYENMKKTVDEGGPGVTKKMVKTAKKMAEKAVKELEKLESGGKKAGKKGGKATADGLSSTDTKKVGKIKVKDYSKGIESGKKDAKKSAKKVAESAKKELEKPDTKKSGQYFAAGFAEGVEKEIGTAGAAVAKVAKASLKRLNKELDEHSPSKKTEQSGMYFGEGFANGIDKRVNLVLMSVGKLAKGSLKTLLSAKNTGKIEKAGEKVVDLYQKGIDKQVSKAEKAVERMIDRAVKAAQKAAKKKNKDSIEKMGSNLADSFSNAFEKAVDKATAKVESKIDSLTSKFQEKFDALNDKKTALNEIYQSGDLFSEDEDGKLVLSDFSTETKNINKIGKNLANLKKKVSKELLAAIVELNTEDQLKITNKLLSLSNADLKAYDKAYNAKLKASQKVSSAFYADQLKKLKEQYTSKVEKELEKLEKRLKKVGENAVKSFVAGLNNKDDEMTKAVKHLSKSLVKKIKKELGIKSTVTVKGSKTAAKAIDKYSKTVVKPMKNAAASMALNMQTAGSSKAATGTVVTNNSYNFNQTNNSPRALSRWDVYRQSKNLLKGVQYV